MDLPVAFLNRPRFCVLLWIGCAIVCLVGLSACAARSVRPPEPELSDRPLPGSSRVLPSVQNQSEASPTAPEACPAPRDGRAPEAPRAASPPSATASGSESRPSAPSDPVGANPNAANPARSDPASASGGRSPEVAPAPPVSSGFSVQLWVSTSKEAAESRREAMERALDVPVRVEAKDGLYRVRAGDFASQEAADGLRRRAILAGCADAFIVPTR